MKKRHPYTDTLAILQDLKKSHPTSTLGQHLSLATAEAGDLAYLTDKQLYTVFKKYADELEYDNGECDDIEKIIKEGSDLSALFSKEEEDDGF